MKVKNKNIPLQILKIFLIIILILVLIVTGGYFYLKHSLNFDLLKLKNTIELINKNYSESKVLSNSFNEDTTYQTFLKIYGDDSVYNLENNQYVFSKQNFEEKQLQQDTLLTDKEICSILSVYLENYYAEDLNLEDDFNNTIKLKQINFLNIEETLNSYIVELNFSYKVSLMDFNTQEELSILNKFIPSKVILTSFAKIEFSKEDFYEYTFENQKIILNDLTEQETQSIFNFFESLGISNASNSLAQDLNSIFCLSLFGNNSTLGILKSILNSNGFDFSLNNNAICIKIKKI